MLNYSFLYKKDLDKITDTVWLGSFHEAGNKELLKKNKITHILVCGSELAENYPQDFNYKKLNLRNYDWSKSLTGLFDETYEFIKQGNCFIHCLAGVHRAPTFTIAYLIKEKGWTVKEAHDYVKSKRKIIEPPEFFLQQLEIYYQDLQKRKNCSKNI
ncbi:hypothetical protein PPERSA_02617 [Pseudocohnilembus persalinus]|uniref:protein-tyrosine-phosphatase n=1 Tax=Pseudocohnilembus persalinus TaxID=266149 RepID=A0A0V0R5G9_PSEPJ|nr:hypothetical protein PPERSA_02617 [Pseudocohnilembus persalinus]|eukprot:KRX09745.1 hypothetical protein PPERSA_02617 [Pseudocohnilembus persalinus]